MRILYKTSLLTRLNNLLYFSKLQYASWNAGQCPVPKLKCYRGTYTVEQKSIAWNFRIPRTGSDVRYSCHHNSCRFTFPIFEHSCCFSVFHSLQSVTPRVEHFKRWILLNLVYNTSILSASLPQHLSPFHAVSIWLCPVEGMSRAIPVNMADGEI
jgi:hypothetical protein